MHIDMVAFNQIFNSFLGTILACLVLRIFNNPVN
jgi:hypothetical protein